MATQRLPQIDQFDAGAYDWRRFVPSAAALAAGQPLGSTAYNVGAPGDFIPTFTMDGGSESTSPSTNYGTPTGYYRTVGMDGNTTIYDVYDAQGRRLRTETDTPNWMDTLNASMPFILGGLGVAGIASGALGGAAAGGAETAAGLSGVDAAMADMAASTAASGTGMAGTGTAAAGSGGLLSSIGDWVSNPSNLLQLGGGLLGAYTSQDQEQTARREPWAPAQPLLANLLADTERLRQQYRDQPFSDAQKTAYGNVTGLLNAINTQAPGLSAGFRANASGANAFDRSNPRRQLTGSSFDMSTLSPGLLNLFPRS